MRRVNNLTARTIAQLASGRDVPLQRIAETHKLGNVQSLGPARGRDPGGVEDGRDVAAAPWVERAKRILDRLPTTREHRCHHRGESFAVRGRWIRQVKVQ